MKSNGSEEPWLIKEIVRQILDGLSKSPMGMPSHVVGLNCPIEELLRLLDVKSNGIRILGLHGIGGVGKTTIAKAVYNKLVTHFEHRSFISNVRKMSMQQNGLISLQNKLLGDLSFGRASKVYDANAGKIAVGMMLHEKRVLIVFDDVDDRGCLGALVAKREWFYKGSRIIITTRDKDVLIAHHVNEIYEVRELGFSDSLDLFRYHALRTKRASETFLSLSEQIVSRTGGLPLALEVFGSFLFDKRTVDEWQDALQKLEDIRPHNLFEHCTSSTTIHKSLGDATTPRHLDLRDCSDLVEFPNDVSGLKNLETLILSGCSKFKELPQKMDCLNSLRKLLVDNTAIEQLPESIFQLTKLEVLSLNGCRSLKRLPFCIGQLSSLRDLSLNGSALEELPNSIGLLINLETLSLMWCTSLTLIPASVVNLKMLAKFWLNGSSVMELPASVGSLSYLKVLSVGNCSSLTKLPVSIGGLSSLVELQLDGTSIVDLPDEVDGLKSLEKLEMRYCKSLRSLPDTFGHLGNLTKLIIVNASIEELPESIGMLENLILLRLNKCVKLCGLPSSIGNLKFLRYLYMEETSLTQLPESFGMLSRLMILQMRKKPYPEVSDNAETRDIANELIVLPSSYSNLSLLEEFDARAWKISGKIPDDFEKLSCLETLNLGHNHFHSLPCSLTGLSILKRLFLPHCENLRVLPPLPSSLLELNAESCTALETLSDLSNLDNLHELNLSNCIKLKDIPGLECLKSLRRLYMSGCSSCSSVAEGKLDKLALKHMYNISVPGSEIPDWFTPEVICYSKPKNRVIKAVIVCVVVSINHQIPDDLRDQLPVVAGIEIKILRENEPKPVFTTGPLLSGVPKDDEDYFYLCRYPNCHPLVSILQEGDKIQVARQNPPVVNGVQLKKCGIHLVFENDDDYAGDENWWPESQQTVSQKLATFVGSSEEGNRTRNRVLKNDGEKEGRKQSKGLLSSNHWKYLVLLFIAFPSAFLLLSWLVFKFIT